MSTASCFNTGDLSLSGPGDLLGFRSFSSFLISFSVMLISAITGKSSYDDFFCGLLLPFYPLLFLVPLLSFFFFVVVNDIFLHFFDIFLVIIFSFFCHYFFDIFLFLFFCFLTYL